MRGIFRRLKKFFVSEQCFFKGPRNHPVCALNLVKRNNTFHRVPEYARDLSSRHGLGYAGTRLRRSEIRWRNFPCKEFRFLTAGKMTDVPIKPTPKVQIKKSRFFEGGQDSAGLQHLMKPACTRS